MKTFLRDARAPFELKHLHWSLQLWEVGDLVFRSRQKANS